MQVIPAIDIRRGRCARLFKGDYERETVFDNDPLDAALRWIDTGANRLHIIDLDGAKDGTRTNAETIRRVVNSIDVPVQMGGGIRSLDDAAAVLDMGVELAILGTIAIENPEIVEKSVEEFGAEHICVSVDAKNGMVRTRGWLTDTSLSAIDVLKEMSAIRKVRNFIYTDTERDGTLSHPNFNAVSEIVREIEYPIMIAGGIASVSDVVQLRDIGAAGAITGMAIYTGALNLTDAISAASETNTN